MVDLEVVILILRYVERKYVMIISRNKKINLFNSLDLNKLR